ncbi:MAG: aminotransferase class V-fold PLP-dependent enzyme, partial [Deltaproteobacteria bacterium]
EARGDSQRSEVLVPDSAHGTNPATASMAGFRTINVPSAADGGVDLEEFRKALGPRTAAVMITNPSTLGLFESRIGELLAAVHEAGALAYMDGANLNAILGRFKPGEAGFDVMHINVHKTFSTPHGGGGPGAGPVGVGEALLPFLPSPRTVHEAGALAYMDGANLNAILGRFKPGEAGFDVMHINVHKTFSTPHGGGGPGAGPVGVGEALLPFLPSPRILHEADGTYRRERPGERPTSIGRLRSFVGNTGVLVRAFAYIRAHGTALGEVTDDAVLAANYLKHRLGEEGSYDIPFERACKHEFVASSSTLKKATGVRTLDVAKRLIDFGFHPPTIYFPHTVDEAMLIEPTETESLETLDAFADAMAAIAAEARATPEVVTTAPHTAPVRRLDEATAARNPDLRWRPMTGRQMPCPD